MLLTVATFLSLEKQGLERFVANVAKSLLLLLLLLLYINMGTNIYIDLERI